jgi:methionyl-tRNA formyltransferase
MIKTKKEKVRVIFMGTPEFGVKSFTSLLDSDFFDIVAVVTQPDKKVGREQKITEPVIKQIAKEKGIKIYQPEKIKTEIELIKSLHPDLIVVVAYGQLIPKDILSLPKFGCVNVHGSLLPKYRGASCLQAPIINGDKYSGITIMLMDEGLDTGPILNQQRIKLAKDETVSTLHDKLSEVGGELLTRTLKRYIEKKIKPKPQKNKNVSYVKTIKKEDGRLDFSKSAQEIKRMIRALNPWPGTFGYINNEALHIHNTLFKILAVRPKPIEINRYQIGEIFVHNCALAIQCGQNSLVIVKLQLEGKRMMTVDDFLRGNGNIIGSIIK